MREHDFAVEQNLVFCNEVLGRRTRGFIHKVPNRKHPCTSDCLVELGARYSVVFDEIQEAFAHPLNSGLDAGFDEIDVSKPHVRLVIELRRRDRAGLEGRAEVAIVLG